MLQRLEGTEDVVETAFTRRQILDAIRTDVREAVLPEAAAVMIGKKEPPLHGALAGGVATVDDLLLAVRPGAERHRDRAPEYACAGIAGQHQIIEHQRLMADLQGPGTRVRCRVIALPAQALLPGAHFATHDPSSASLAST